MKTQRLFALLALPVLLLALAGCSIVATNPPQTQLSTSQPTQATDPSETQGTELTENQTTKPSETQSESYQGVYANLLTTYRTALAEKWSPDQFAAKELSLLCVYEGGNNPIANIGYAIADVTGEGVEDLVIGSLSTDSDKVIFDLYTAVDGKIIHLCSSSERSRYYLRPLEDSGTACELVNSGSSGAGSSEWIVYSIGLNAPGELTISQSVKYDHDENAEDPWFMGFWDGEQIVYSPTDEATAKAIINSLEQTRYFPELMSFGE